jgi:hypothetical protein
MKDITKALQFEQCGYTSLIDVCYCIFQKLFCQVKQLTKNDAANEWYFLYLNECSPDLAAKQPRPKFESVEKETLRLSKVSNL